MLNKLSPNVPNVLGLEVIKKEFFSLLPFLCVHVGSLPPLSFFVENISLKASVQDSRVFFTSFFFFFWRCLSWMSTMVCSSASWHGKDERVPEMSEGPAGCPPRALTHSSPVPLTPSARPVNWQHRSNNCALISGFSCPIQQLKPTMAASRCNVTLESRSLSFRSMSLTSTFSKSPLIEMSVVFPFIDSNKKKSEVSGYVTRQRSWVAIGKKGKLKSQLDNVRSSSSLRNIFNHLLSDTKSFSCCCFPHSTPDIAIH